MTLEAIKPHLVGGGGPRGDHDRHVLAVDVDGVLPQLRRDQSEAIQIYKDGSRFKTDRAFEDDVS